LIHHRDDGLYRAVPEVPADPEGREDLVDLVDRSTRLDHLAQGVQQVLDLH
jgi:hypothetical protein